ncbi:uncharacterized protein TRUGW13939_02316 [Talaromyces rugulosus]|uniref:Phytanoyl-CoA dioxygenase family protein n=1 Tax=Talaromyces rugulosus TaxID=121627 RepID=A0A7H8QMU5_TALRU|nr:uncharacterized protein TRUGW13939_02316 [Talaromyces rugulosus]QKX55224.1 hypothetical protein TRUGW13939_02316 [Talaromyces rugulosus]
MAVDEFDYTTNPKADGIVASLVHSGGCIIRNLITDYNVLEKIENDVRPHIEADRPWIGVDFCPPETRRVMENRALSPKPYQTILCIAMYVLDCCARPTVLVSEPQLSNTIVFSIGPGAKRQELHRDDSIHHNKLPELASYHDCRIGRDTSVGLSVAGKKPTKANGATRFIPGSHLWGEERCPDEDLAYYAELQPGDAFLMLASCYHGGSANTTADEERLVYSCFMTKGFLRQEENQYLVNSLEQVKQYPRDVQKLIGYSVSKPFLGWVNLEDPIKMLYNDGKVEGNGMR